MAGNEWPSGYRPPYEFQDLPEVLPQTQQPNPYLGSPSDLGGTRGSLNAVPGLTQGSTGDYDAGLGDFDPFYTGATEVEYPYDPDLNLSLNFGSDFDDGPLKFEFGEEDVETLDEGTSMQDALRDLLENKPHAPVRRRASSTLDGLSERARGKRPRRELELEKHQPNDAEAAVDTVEAKSSSRGDSIDAAKEETEPQFSLVQRWLNEERRKPTAEELGVLVTLTKASKHAIEHYVQSQLAGQLGTPVIVHDAAVPLEPSLRAKSPLPGETYHQQETPRPAPQGDVVHELPDGAVFPKDATTCAAAQEYRDAAPEKCVRSSRARNTQGGKYQCTSRCGASTGRKDDWKKHEEISQPQHFYACRHCHETRPKPHICHRKDKLKEHLASTHPEHYDGFNKVQYRVYLEASKVAVDGHFKKRCGFCNAEMSTWEHRNAHILEHFDDGFTMSQWQDPWVDEGGARGGDDEPPSDPPGPPDGRPGPSGNHGSSTSGRRPPSFDRQHHSHGNDNDQGGGSAGQPSNYTYGGSYSTCDADRTVYKPLLSRESYRLLRLEPGQNDERLVGYLIDTSLTESDYEYDAFSYQRDSLGDPVELVDMICHGWLLSIPIRLALFLRRLRRPDEPRLLWVDTICVNSRDHTEHAQQSRLLQFIFEKARSSLVWDGDQDSTRSVVAGVISSWSKPLEVEEQNSITGHVARTLITLPFRHLENLGHGSHGLVDKVEVRSTSGSSAVFARKTVYNPKREVSVKRQFIREVTIVRSLRHRFIMPFLTAYTEDHSLNLIMSSVADRNLKEYLESPPREEHMGDEVRQWFGDLVSGLSYLHSKRIRHADLKPANILISGAQVYIADFGISRVVSEPDSTSSSISPMTPLYAAPEIAKRQKHGRSADIFSLGLVLLEMCIVLMGRSIGDFHASIDLHTNRQVSPQRVPVEEGVHRKHWLYTKASGSYFPAEARKRILHDGMKPSEDLKHARGPSKKRQMSQSLDESSTKPAHHGHKNSYYQKLDQITAFIERTQESRHETFDDKKQAIRPDYVISTIAFLSIVQTMLQREASLRPPASLLANVLISSGYLPPVQDLDGTSAAGYPTLVAPEAARTVLTLALCTSLPNTLSLRGYHFAQGLLLQEFSITQSRLWDRTRQRDRKGPNVIGHSKAQQRLVRIKLDECIRIIHGLSCTAPDSIANAPGPVRLLWMEVIMLADLLWSIHTASEINQSWSRVLVYRNDLSRTFGRVLSACCSTLQNLFDLMKEISAMRAKVANGGLVIGNDTYQKATVLQDQLSSHHQGITLMVQAVWFSIPSGSVWSTMQEEKTLTLKHHTSTAIRTKTTKSSQKQNSDQAICKCACRQRLARELREVGSHVESATENYSPSLSTEEDGSVEGSEFLLQLDDTLVEEKRDVQQMVYDDNYWNNLPPAERFFGQICISDSLVKRSIHAYASSLWATDTPTLSNPPTSTNSGSDLLAKRARTDTTAPPTPPSTVPTPLRRGSGQSSHSDKSRRRLVTAMRRYRHKVPMGKPSPQSDLRLGRSQTDKLELVSKPPLNTAKSWDNKSTQSNRSNKSSFVQYGRHANSWLFGDFSFRYTIREAWEKWM